MQTKIKWFLLVALLIPCWVMGIKYEIDLVNLHATAKFLIQDYTRVYAQNGTLGRYFYGPFSLILIKPLGYLSFPTVKYIWLCLQTLCYYLFWKLLTQLYPFLNNKKYFWGWLLVWIVSINPIHNNYQSNNIQLMLAALLLAGEKLTQSSKRANQIWGGILVTFAAGIKVFPAFLVIYYFLAKNLTVKKGILIGGLLVLVTPFLFLGFNESVFLYRGFIENLTTYSAENSLTLTNDILCLPSLLARWSVPSRISAIVSLSLSATFFLWVLFHRKYLSQNREQLHFLALAWALSVFLNPSTRPHYFIFYVPAFCSILEVIYNSSSTKILNLGMLLSVLLIAFTAEGVVGRPLNEFLEAASVPTYGMILLCLMLLMAIFKCNKANGTSAKLL